MENYVYSVCPPKQTCYRISTYGFQIEAFLRKKFGKYVLFRGDFICNKFITIKNGKTGLDNTRLETLLDSLGLNERLVDDDRTCERIDYKKVEEKLLILKEKATKYLEKIVVG